jgi:hypothetical protein
MLRPHDRCNPNDRAANGFYGRKSPRGCPYAERTQGDCQKRRRGTPEETPSSQEGEAVNDAQKAYIDGAAMAYQDVADKMNEMIDKAPAPLKDLMETWRPFARSVEAKAKGIHEEAERMEGATPQ